MYFYLYMYLILKIVCCWYTHICFIYFLLVFLHRDVISVGWYNQVVGKPTHGDSLLDIYLVRPEGELITCKIVKGISDHCGVLLDVE